MLLQGFDVYRVGSVSLGCKSSVSNIANVHARYSTPISNVQQRFVSIRHSCPVSASDNRAQLNLGGSYKTFLPEDYIIFGIPEKCGNEERVCIIDLAGSVVDCFAHRVGERDMKRFGSLQSLRVMYD